MTVDAPEAPFASPSTPRPPAPSEATASKRKVSPAPSEWPLCWGHRGASAAYPENTLASFEAAIRDGAEGLESDVWMSLDGEIVMFHDPILNRTTNGSGRIQAQNYVGGIDQLKTRKTPPQQIPTFRQTMALLMRPENRHVSINIDIKPANDPKRLFTLMHEIVTGYDGYETSLGPRLVLGLWHPRYLGPALEIVPYMRRVHIGVSPDFARKYFWDACDGFSLRFAALSSTDGAAFRAECRAARKDLFVWTVNTRPQMIDACKWHARGILTDHPAKLLELRQKMKNDWPAVSAETTGVAPWYTPLLNIVVAFLFRCFIRYMGGPIHQV